MRGGEVVVKSRNHESLCFLSLFEGVVMKNQENERYQTPAYMFRFLVFQCAPMHASDVPLFLLMES